MSDPCYYHGEFLADVPHGLGIWTDTSLNHKPQRVLGKWHHGSHERELYWLPDTRVTEDFQDHFKVKADFVGMYALGIVRQLPRLPLGVDPTNDGVLKIIRKIVIGETAPDIIGCDRVRENLRQTQTLELDRALKFESKERIEEAAEELDVAIERSVETLEQEQDKYEHARVELYEVQAQLESYWSSPEHRVCCVS